MEGLLTLLTKIFAFLQKVLASLACFVHNLFIFVATLLFTTLKSYLNHPRKSKGGTNTKIALMYGGIAHRS